MATAIESAFKAIGSQIQPSSPVGRLLELLSRAVGQTQQAIASEKQFFQAKNSADQAIGAPTNIVVDEDIAARGISRVSANTFQLTPGKTYLLEAHGRFVTFGAVTDAIQYRWVDDTEVALPQTGPDAVSARVLPMTSTLADSSLPSTSVIYTVPEGGGPESQVRVRATVVTGSMTIPANGFQVTITEL